MRQSGILQSPTWTNHDDYATGKLRDNTQSGLDELASKPDLQTVILEGLELTYGYNNLVHHGLSTTPIGYKIGACDTLALVKVTDINDKYLELTVSTDCIVDIMVY
jgi:hypothetical protein